MSTEYARYFSALDDYNAGDPIDDRDIDGEFDAIKGALNRKVMAKGTAPASPTNGDTWVDTTNKLLKYYRVSEWVCIGAVHIGTSAPSTPQEGDLWYDTTNNLLKSYNGSSWATAGNMIHPASTAAGDILYYTAANTLARLAKGTTSQVLKGGDAPSWGMPADLAIASQADKDILYFDGSNWVRLAKGTANISYVGSQLFTANGTFTAPPGVTKISVTMCGGGGGGGSVSGSDAGGGGGAGESIINYIYTVTPGNGYAVAVGAAGAGGTTGGNGTAGGNTTFDSTGIVASGGGAGLGSASQTGGTGGGGVLDASGGTPGAAGIKGGNGADAVVAQGGGGGASMFGAGGSGGGVGGAATGYGAGGGGSGSGGTDGGAGSAGFCLVQW